MKHKYTLISCLVICMNASILADEGTAYNIKGNRTDADSNPISKINYDKNIFDLAYKAFVYSGNVEDAYALATSAVRQLPKSIAWRERLAQTAMWTNNVEIAIEEYTDLIIQFKQDQFIIKTLTLSKQLNRYGEMIPLLTYILKSKPNDIATINDLATAYDYMGDPIHAKNILEKANKRLPNKIFLEHIAYIYGESDTYHKQYATLNKVNSEYGISVKNALIQAEIKYNHAELNTALQNLVAVPHQKTVADQPFWQTKGDLAWLLGKYDLSYSAYLRLYQLNKIDVESMRRLMILQARTRDLAALNLAIINWHKFHTPSAFLFALSLAIDLQAWDKIAYLYQLPIPPDTLIILQSESDYWLGKALLIQHNGSPALARQFLLTATITHHDVDNLGYTYFDFLLAQLQLAIKDQQPRYWLAALNYYQQNATLDENWAMAYMSSFLLLDKPDKALLIQYSLGPDVTIKYWNSIYPDLLDLFNYNKTAYHIRQQNWWQIQQDSTKHPSIDHPFWRAYSGLASYFAPIAVSYGINRYLASHATSPSDYESLLKWAVDNEHYELSAYLAAYCYPNGLPSWAALKLAMWKNDKYAIRQMIATMPEVLPRKDRTEAAVQAGYPALAQSFAYDTEKQTADADRYEIMKNVMLTSANTATAATEFEQFSNVQGFREIVKAKLFYTPFFAITPYASYWDGYTNNPGDLANYPYIEQLAGVKLAYETPRNIITLDTASHRFLFNTVLVDLKDEYTFSNDITFTGELAYNQRSTLDQFMMIAGAQDEAIAAINYQPTVNDTLLGQFEFDNYHTQNHKQLGNGKILTGQYEHKFCHEYPDYSVGVTGSINRYAKLNTLIDGKILEIIPANAIADTTLFIPQNFWQVETYFKFGNNIAEEYTHEWLPYADIGILYDSVVGKGTDIDLGIAGMVFGRDKLMIYGSRSTINSGISSINFIAGMSYTLYF